MSNVLPKTLEEATVYGLQLLSVDSKRELARIGLFNPHAKYETDFLAIIGSGLGIMDGTNSQLLQDIAAHHSDALHFLESDGKSVEPDAAIRVLLTAMSKAAAAE